MILTACTRSKVGLYVSTQNQMHWLGLHIKLQWFIAQSCIVMAEVYLTCDTDHRSNSGVNALNKSSKHFTQSWQ